MTTTLITRESGKARFMLLLNAYMVASRTAPIEAYDADGEEGTESGFALKIGGELYAFTLAEADVLIEVKQDIAISNPADAKAVDLGLLIRITKEIADRTRARLAGSK